MHFDWTSYNFGLSKLRESVATKSKDWLRLSYDRKFIYDPKEEWTYLLSRCPGSTGYQEALGSSLWQQGLDGETSSGGSG